MTIWPDVVKPVRLSAAVALVSMTACASSTGPASISHTHPGGAVYGTTIMPARPYSLGISSRGVVVVGQADSAQVRLGTLPDTGLSRAVPVGAMPTGLAVNPAGTRAYVADQFAGRVAVVDLISGSLVDAIPVPGNPFVVTVAPDGRSIFVSSNTDTVYQFGTNHALLAAIGGPGTVNALTFSPNHLHLYASIPFSGVVQDIAVTSVVNLTLLRRTLRIPGAPQGLAVSADGATLYVASETSSYLYAVALESGTVVDSIDVGGGGFALALTPDGTQLYLTQSSAGRLTILTLATRGTVSLDLGGAPRRLAFDPTGAYAVVANESGWVTYIR